MSASEMKYVEGLINKMKVIQKILPPSPPRLLGSGSGQQTLSSPGSSSGGASLLLKKRLTPTVLVLLVALVAGLLFLLPGGLLQAQQDNMTTVNFAENGEDAVAMFTATDPEGATPITWSVADADDVNNVEGIDTADAADAEDFTIDPEDGMLKFSSPPDFENPSGENAASNTYKVVVAACDVSAADCANGQTGYHRVTVMVTDVNEPGKVTLATAGDGTPQYLVGATLTATASDGDITNVDQIFTVDEPGEVTGVTWRWYRGGAEITGEDAQDNTYTLQLADANNRIRVVVYYIVTGNVDQEMAEETTDYPVLAVLVGDNQLKFDPAAVSRTISEGAEGRNVGAAVTATGNHGTVRYALSGTDSDQFEIDEKTGQITTLVALDYEGAAGGPDQCNTLNACVVTVTATDSTGEPTSTDLTNLNATVAITLTDVNEEPDFDTGSQTVSVPENSTDLFDASADGYSFRSVVDVTYTAMDPEGRTVSYSLAGPDASKFQLSGLSPVLSFASKPDFEAKASADGDNVYEVTVRASVGGDTGEQMVRVTVGNVDEGPDVSGLSTRNFAENGEDAVAMFTATDPEGATPITWSVADADDVNNVEGIDTADAADAEDFTIDPEDGMLKFSSPPDFENPSGENAASNTYKVVVAACDVSAADCANGQTGYHRVTVMVTDVNEPGKVTLATAGDGTPQYLVGATLTATASDGDITNVDQIFTVDEPGEVTGVTWRWYRGGAEITGEDAQDNTYTLQLADANNRIRVVVTYRVGPNTNQERASLTTDYPVLAVLVGDNQLKFDPAAVSRTISEGAEGRNVGAAVTATGNHGTVRYALSGTDSDQFEIDEKTGQITTLVALDYEGAAGGPDQCNTLNACVVTVTATDSTGEPTSTDLTNLNATVAITLTDVNEEPDFDTGSQIVSVPENSTDLFDASADGYSFRSVVDVTYTAMDPEGRTVSYSLAGPDASKFQLSATPPVLSFASKPDFEAKASADGDNVYEVTVRASVGGDTGEQMVRVTVGNVDEAPEIMLGGLAISGMSSVSYDENGTDPVETYTASGPDAASATWSLSGDDAGDFSINTAGMLTFRNSPDYENAADADTNNVYMVTVNASDGTNMDTRDVTVTVTNVDDPGTVTLWVGTDALTGPAIVGEALTGLVVDADGSVTVQSWRWMRADSAAGQFADITGATLASYTPVEADASMYIKVMATYTDAEGSGKTAESPSVMVQTVASVDEPGTVTLWVGTDPLTGPAIVGEALTGLVVDADGSVTVQSWRWMKADSAAGQFADITGATLASYTPVEADASMYIKVMATYTDAEGSGKTAESPSVMVQLEAAPMTLLERYDADDNGQIDKSEVVKAINDYLDGEGDLAKADVITIINLYLDGS